jgi:hypothetical protein
MEERFMSYVRIPQVLHLSLELHLFETGRNISVDVFAAEMLERWLKLERERLDLKSKGPPLHGYQWKEIFLPNGTSLRTTYQGMKRYAKVVGEHLMADDRSLSPSQFANQGAPPGRNAWKTIWIRFPGEESWVRALDTRRMQRSADR